MLGRDIIPPQESDEGSWLIEFLRAHPHLGPEDLLTLLSRGNGPVGLEALDLDADSDLLTSRPSWTEVENQAIELLQAHPHLSPEELLTLLSRGNGPLTPKDSDLDVDSDLLNLRFSRIDEED